MSHTILNLDTLPVTPLADPCGVRTTLLARYEAEHTLAEVWIKVGGRVLRLVKQLQLGKIRGDMLRNFPALSFLRNAEVYSFDSNGAVPPPIPEVSTDLKFDRGVKVSWTPVKRRIVNSLKTQGLLGYTDGTITKPPPITITISPPT
ncbi:MAG: hypothetical protein NXY57DRAFT_1037684 [Lentinula lateritia]|nr:MAG: hypothetical protein NXY57DRAFT_1037684 [Lentinula lateritia]